MADEEVAIAEHAQQWLTRFEDVIADCDEHSLRRMFHEESYWRDVLALTWSIETVNGSDAVVAALVSRMRAKGFSVEPSRLSVRRVTRAGTAAIEALFRFETEVGEGRGVLRLTPEDGTGALRAWTLLTALEELHVPEGAGSKSYSRDFRGPNWLDLRRQSAAYSDRDPAVLVVGGGQAGLSIAARLSHLGVDTLIVDREARVGDNWRKRYHALTLHNQTHVNHLPYMPFPANWPTYIPKDKLAGWFEAYVESLELNYWTGTEFEGGGYDASAERWDVNLRRADGSVRVMHPRHVVMATGVSGIPKIPDIPTLRDFRGTVLHSSQYQDGEEWTGRSTLVIGTGNSGHDIAQDLHSGGAKVTLVQRSPTLIVNIEPSAQLPYASYSEGLSLEESDLVTTSMPLALARKSHVRFTQQSREMDRELLDGLRRVGFELDFGEDETGWQFKYLTRGGGYYFNVGCSDLIVAGEIGLVQFSDIARFVAEGAELRSGETLPADLVVLATGYEGQEYLVRKLFGEQVAGRVGAIWGFGEGQELRNMFVRTGQPGLWFIAGSLAQCRIYSKYLALQIKACEMGLIDKIHHGDTEARRLHGGSSVKLGVSVVRSRE